MPNSALSMLILAVLVIVLFLVYKRHKTEGFVENRDLYIESSSKRYNPLADQYDITRPHFAKTNDPVQLDRVTAEIKSAMATAEVQPVPQGSRFGIKPEPIHISMPPANEIVMKSNQCETIQGRSCDALRDPKNNMCGICIKGGTANSKPDMQGKFTGGLFILPEDRAEAEARAGRGEASYAPTVGDCEPGYFFVSADKCERAKNRLECAEAGEAGGFDGTMKDIARSKCAQVMNGDTNMYIYEPRGRRFNMNLRVITPTGVGIVKVFVNRASNNELIGSMTIENSGKEFIVPVRNVGEGEEVNVKVLEEVPHRPRGRSEVFHYYRNQAGYTETISSSTKVCESLGARIATNDELVEAQRKGAQVCSCGNTTTTNGYPTVSNLAQFGIWGCGSPGVNFCGTDPQSWNGGKGGSWCVGVKPPEKIINMELFSKVFPFFQQITPKEEKANIWSEHGDDYQAPAYRGVIMQWESEDGKRSAPFEPSIVKVNGAGPSTTAKDGTMTFSNLRRLGTFASSAMILAPRPSGAMLRNQFWIWNNQPTSQTVVFSSKIPGVFKDPFYAEDVAVAPRGPLISTPETMKLMRTSPCLRDGEEPGKYSSECLNSLFRSAGGDSLRGTLATENGGLLQLLKLGDLDKISEYLANLYSIATKGRDTMGNRVGSSSVDRIAKINDAAQKMFGFDIATPCEDITEDAAGNMVLVQKTGSLNADCLDYLWMNTGNDRERGNEDRTRTTSISNTYTTIWDRYSGLRSNEGSVAKRSQYPFQACQRTGSKAPVGADGKPNMSAISEANAKGDMKAIQNWYNEIHVNANYMNPSKDNNPRHKEFMKQCYGVDRIDRIPNVIECDGVLARYVRVLATAVNNGSPDASCIQIPQIQVFDTKNIEVAKGKPTTSKSVGWGGTPEKAVNGLARPHSHYEGQYHDDCTTPDRQFWMVDLGSTMKISRVVFYPRTDCCTDRQFAAPIQLLNDSKQIVAQQWIGQGGVPMNQAQNLIFTSDLTKPIYPISSMKPGMRISVMSSTSFDRYLRHSGFAMWVGGTKGKDMDSTFTIQPARNGNAGMVSFESVNYPGRFIRHAGFRCWLHAVGGSQVEKDDTSFAIVPALNGDPSMVSFRSSNFPTHYLATRRDASSEVWITPVDTTNVWDVQRVSWKVVPGLA